MATSLAGVKIAWWLKSQAANAVFIRA